ncbi:N-acyl-D-amino-acid deacylase family protein [Sinosporangium siamense]|uniref:Dihydroorotase n=1 Tax=Sinosporangium siamense TaxID=1367973 RepID=A0A919RI54_9ACTN|nr:amidohydrolase family protein [Sinosporangium siamense]GII94073.1 dihydroorotase [Sinosporangium siamense]
MPSTLIIRGGTVYDGTGTPGRLADVAVEGDRILGVGHIPDSEGAVVLDATGCAVAPGFINVLSHAYFTLQQDPRGLSDLYQGVTTEIFGEGLSMGPVAGRMLESVPVGKVEADGTQLGWPRLADFLNHMSSAGVAPNIASFVGSHNLRMLGAGNDHRPLTRAELDAAAALLDEELSDGALGVGSALIYPPDSYSSTEELISLMRVLGRHDALYISHIRSEADRLVEGIEEILRIGREAETRVEVYHLKAAGRDNWHKMKLAIDLIDAARATGQPVTADLYPYEAGSTALASVIPPPFHAGGQDRLLERLRDRGAREEMKAAIRRPSAEWENLYLVTGGPDQVLLLSNAADGSPTAGKTLAEAAARAGVDDPVEHLLDLVLGNPEMMAAYFMGHQDNIRLALSRPWVSICSDSESVPAEPPFSDLPVHPRAYGSFAKILGQYVRDEGLLTLEEAVRRMTSLPADTLRLAGRGRIASGAYADLVVFDPATIRDHATYEDPHQYATGVRHVVINGTAALRDGTPTGALPGRALRRGQG